MCEVPVLYATSEGQTRRIAERIAERLRQDGVDAKAILIGSKEADEDRLGPHPGRLHRCISARRAPSGQCGCIRAPLQTAAVGTSVAVLLGEFGGGVEKLQRGCRGASHRRRLCDRHWVAAAAHRLRRRASGLYTDTAGSRGGSCGASPSRRASRATRAAITRYTDWNQVVSLADDLLHDIRRTRTHGDSGDRVSGDSRKTWAG